MWYVLRSPFFTFALIRVSAPCEHRVPFAKVIENGAIVAGPVSPIGRNTDPLNVSPPRAGVAPRTAVEELAPTATAMLPEIFPDKAPVYVISQAGSPFFFAEAFAESLTNEPAMNMRARPREVMISPPRADAEAHPRSFVPWVPRFHFHPKPLRGSTLRAWVDESPQAASATIELNNTSSFISTSPLEATLAMGVSTFGQLRAFE